MGGFADHWIHGVATIARWPEKAHMLIHSSGYTKVVQEPDLDGDQRENWFYLPIPTPTMHENSAINLVYVHFRGWVNENATVTEVQIREGEALLYKDDSMQWTNTSIDETIQLKEPVQVRGGINFGVRVRFLDGKILGEAKFFGAGGRFEIV